MSAICILKAGFKNSKLKYFRNIGQQTLKDLRWNSG